MHVHDAVIPNMHLCLQHALHVHSVHALHHICASQALHMSVIHSLCKYSVCMSCSTSVHDKRTIITAWRITLNCKCGETVLRTRCARTRPYAVCISIHIHESIVIISTYIHTYIHTHTHATNAGHLGWRVQSLRKEVLCVQESGRFGRKMAHK
jgi:hypothetical protein